MKKIGWAIGKVLWPCLMGYRGDTGLWPAEAAYGCKEEHKSGQWTK